MATWDNLNLLRGVGALMIVVHHVNFAIGTAQFCIAKNDLCFFVSFINLVIQYLSMALFRAENCRQTLCGFAVIDTSTSS